jgi:hypothetical protein
MLTGIARSLIDVSDSSCLDDVADHKLLDGLVLGHTPSAVGATDRVHMTPAVLGASSVASFAGLKISKTSAMVAM